MQILSYIHAWPATWWRHQRETFSALLAICAGNSPVSGEFPAKRPVMRGFYVFFDLYPNKRLSKQLWSWWFETHSPPLWRHSIELWTLCIVQYHKYLTSCPQNIWAITTLQRHSHWAWIVFCFAYTFTKISWAPTDNLKWHCGLSVLLCVMQRSLVIRRMVCK